MIGVWLCSWMHDIHCHSIWDLFSQSLDNHHYWYDSREEWTSFTLVIWVLHYVIIKLLFDWPIGLMGSVTSGLIHNSILLFGLAFMRQDVTQVLSKICQYNYTCAYRRLIILEVICRVCCAFPPFWKLMIFCWWRCIVSVVSIFQTTIVR